MRELIRRILREETNKLLLEDIDFIDLLVSGDEYAALFANPHSMSNTSEDASLYNLQHNSDFFRITPDEAIDTIKKYKDAIIQTARVIVNNCKTEKCKGLIVANNIEGFEFHMWVNKTTANKIQLIINTSIYYPKELTNKFNDPKLIINKGNNIRIKWNRLSAIAKSPS